MPLGAVINAKGECIVRMDGTRVLVELELPPKETAGKIVLPDSYKHEEPIRLGKVMATGPGRVELGEKIEMRYKKAQVVLIPAFSGDPIFVKGTRNDNAEGKEEPCVTEYRIVEQDVLRGWVEPK